MANQPDPNRSAPSDPATWLDRHGDALYRYAILRLREPAAAEDAVQETLLAALRARESFQRRAAERTWLIGILRNKILDHLRKHARRHTREGAPLEDAPNAAPAEFDAKGLWAHGPAKWGAAPEQFLADAELRAALRVCLDALPSLQRQAFILRDLDNLATDEICKILSVTATNLGTLLHRARTQLRRCVEQKHFRGG